MPKGKGYGPKKPEAHAPKPMMPRMHGAMHPTPKPSPKKKKGT